MRRKSVLDRMVRQAFLVFCHDGMVFSGLLTEHDAGMLVFADVKVHQNEGNPQPVEGSIYIAPAKVAYVQRVPNAAG